MSTTTADTVQLRFGSALSQQADTSAAVDEVVRLASAPLSAPADLAVCFASPHHAPACDALLGRLNDQLGARVLIGCSGESIVGVGREVEEGPALSLWLAQLPGASIEPMHLEFERTAEGAAFSGWPKNLPAAWPQGSALLLLGEPFSFPADALLARLADDQPGIPVLGGMASGAHRPGENRVFLGRQSIGSGAVAALVNGPFNVRSVVSQGCRPIGRPYVVTKADRNVIYELSGKPALLQLQEVLSSLSASELELVNHGLHVGRVINEQQESFSRGDFLIRNCVGADRNSGAIAIGDLVRVGQTVQFHVRDAASADEDLRELLGTLGSVGDTPPAGALLFTCNGRGTRMFDRPHHDAAALRERLGEVPLAGFFAMGEIGPVGGKNFVHGFTASVALFQGKVR